MTSPTRHFSRNMYDTESVFNVIASDDTERRVASRRALALAHIRVESHLGEFLRQAASQEDFEARLAACQEEFAGYIVTAAREHGYEHPEFLERSLVSHYQREAKGKKHWIDKAIKHPGELHRELGVPEGEKIPESKIEEAEHSDNPKERERAQLAETLKGFHHKKKKKSDTEHEADANQRDAMVKEAPGKQHMKGVSPKRNRQYEHIKEQLEESGKSEERAKEEAARTVNKTRRKHHELKKDSGAAMQPGTTMQQAIQEAPPQVPPPTTPQQMQQMGSPAQMPDPLQPQDLGQQQQMMQPDSLQQIQNPYTFASKREWTPFLGDKTSGFGPGRNPNPQGSPGDGTENYGMPYEQYEQGYDPAMDMSYMNPQFQDPSFYEDPYAEQYGEAPMYDNLEAVPPRRAAQDPWEFSGADPYVCPQCGQDSRWCPHGQGLQQASPSEWIQPPEAGFGDRYAPQPSRWAATENLVICPECGGRGKTANQNECPKCKGRGKVADFGPSVLDQLEASVHTAEGHGNTGLGGPEPKMDKRLWTPQTVGDPDPDSRQHPIRRKDVLEPGKKTNDEPLSEIGERTNERVDLPANSGDAGFDTTQKPNAAPHTKTWSGESDQHDPVTREVLD